jgi:hypothetical protein
LSALQVVLPYQNLLAVEDTFKTTKALLTTRPIFHKTDAAIRGHIFCSFLAALLRKELFDRRARGTRAIAARVPLSAYCGVPPWAHH